jgi:RecA/RadA recombinase
MANLKVAGKRDFLSRVVTSLNKMKPKTEDAGTYTVTRAVDDSPSAIRYVIKTGIRPFDDRVGGISIGKVTELCGLPGCGKTNMAVRICVRAEQGHIFERIPSSDGSTFTLKKLKPGTFQVTVLYFDNEGSLSDPFMKVVDGSKMDGVLEQCDTVDLLWKTMERVVDMADAEEKDTGLIQIVVVVIDTVASVSTKEELKKEWGKQDYPRGPAQIKEGFRVMIRRLQRENVLLIGTNHVSKKFDSHGKPVFRAWEYDTPGGKAFAYYCHNRIYFEPIMSRYRLSGKKGEVDGLSVYFFTTKNRLRPPLREGRMSFLFGERTETGEIVKEGGFNPELSILEALIHGKAAKVAKESGHIRFRFDAFEIETTTFGPKVAAPAEPAEPVALTLEEQDDAVPAPRKKGKPAPDVEEDIPVIKKDPKISCRHDWSAFYKEHEKDIEALYAEVHKRCFTTQAQGPDVEDEEDEEDDD